MERQKRYRKLILLVIDVGIINIAYMLGFLLRFTSNVPSEELNIYIRQLPCILIVYLVSFFIFRLL